MTTNSSLELLGSFLLWLFHWVGTVISIHRILNKVHLLVSESHQSTAIFKLLNTRLFVTFKSINAGLQYLAVANFCLPSLTKWNNMIIFMTEWPMTSSQNIQHWVTYCIYSPSRWVSPWYCRSVVPTYIFLCLCKYSFVSFFILYEFIDIFVKDNTFQRTQNWIARLWLLTLLLH